MSNYFSISNGLLSNSIYSTPLETTNTYTNSVVISGLDINTQIFNGEDVSLYGLAVNLSSRPDPIQGDLTVSLHNQQTDVLLQTNSYKLSSFTKYDGSYNYTTIHPQNWQVLKFSQVTNLNSTDKYYFKLSTNNSYISLVGGDTVADIAQNVNGALKGKISNAIPPIGSRRRSFDLTGEDFKYIEFESNANYSIGEFFTIDGYYYLTDLSSEWIPLINSGIGWDSASSDAWGLSYNTQDQCLYFWKSTATSSSFFKARANITVNRWTYISVSRFRNILSFWVDGVCINADARHTTMYNDGNNGNLFINLLLRDNEPHSANMYVCDVRIRNTSSYNPTIAVPVDPLSIRKYTSFLYAEPYTDYYLATDIINNNLVFKLFEDQINIYNDVDQALFIPQKSFPTNSLISDNNFPLFNLTEYNHLNFDKKYYYTAPISYGDFSKLDFTVECWVYVPAISAFIDDTQQLCSYSLNPTPNNTLFNLNIILSPTEAPKLHGAVAAGGTLYEIIAGDIFIDSWTHIALVRKENKLKTFVQGVKQQEITVPITLNTSLNYILSVGGDKNGEHLFYGYLTNIRFHRGYAIYSEDFDISSEENMANIFEPVPLAPFSKDVEVTAPANPSPVVYDEGDKFNFFQAATGVSLTDVSPFIGEEEKTVISSTSAEEITFNFNINNTLSLGDKNFTIEAWINLPSLPATEATGSSYILLQLLSNSSQILTFYISQTTLLLSLPTIPSYQSPRFIHNLQLNTWHHIAAVYKEGELYFFVDGSLLNQQNNQSLFSYKFRTFAPFDSFRIGECNGGRIKMPGIITNLRVIRGTALYEKNFSSNLPENANLLSPKPFQLSSYNIGTGYHYNDNITAYRKNISPYTSNFNIGSLYFNGNSTYTPLNPTLINYIEATSNVCLEFWIKPEKVSDTQTMHRVLTTNGFAIKLQNISDQLALIVHQSINGVVQPFFITATSFPLDYNTWYYIALVRNNKDIFLFINNTLAIVLPARVITFTWNFATNFLRFGSASAEAEYFKGYIADIKISSDISRFKHVQQSDLNTEPGVFTPVEPLPTTVSDVDSLTITQTLTGTFSHRAINIVPDTPFSSSNFPDERSFDINMTPGWRPTFNLSIIKNVDLSGPFTIEGWIKLDENRDIDHHNIIAGQTDSFYWCFRVLKRDGSTVLQLRSPGFSDYPPSSSGVIIQTVFPFETNQWYHVAIIRNSNDVYTFLIDGVVFLAEVILLANSSLYKNLTPTKRLLIGSDYYIREKTKGGYVTNVRLTPSVIYDIPDSLEPPNVTVEPVIPDSNSLILMKEDGVNVDSYLQATFEDGTTQIGRSGGYGTTMTGVIDNTLYPGATFLLLYNYDNLNLRNAANTLCTGDFTLEFFLKIEDNTGGLNILKYVVNNWMGRTNGQPAFFLDYTGSSSKTVKFTVVRNDVAKSVTSTPLTSNTWYHVAIVRSSNTLGLYLNGALASAPLTYTEPVGSTSISSNGSFNLHNRNGPWTAEPLGDRTGLYISDLHLARNETITTRPFSKIDFIPGNTILLISGATNFTNKTDKNYSFVPSRAIFSKTDIVGPPGYEGTNYSNRSISYPGWAGSAGGGHSLLFSKDIIDIFNNQIGAGDFTIEYWWKGLEGLYVGSNISSNSNRLYHRSSTGELIIIFSSKSYVFFNNALLNSANWKHIIIVRKNSKLGVYINGVPIALVDKNTKQISYSFHVSESFNFNFNNTRLFFSAVGPYPHSGGPTFIQDFHIAKVAKYNISDTSIATLAIPTTPLSESEYPGSAVIKGELVPALFEENDSLIFTDFNETLDVIPRIELREDFVLDFWYYPNDSTFALVCLLGSYNNNQLNWTLWVNGDRSTDRLKVTLISNLVGRQQTSRVCIKYKQWNHIAIAVKRNFNGELSNNLTLFVNGEIELVTKFVTALSNGMAVTAPNFIGRNDVGNNRVRGAISNIQILTKTSTFTGVPTAAPTTTAQTKFLYKKPYTFFTSSGGITYQLQTLPLPHANAQGLFSFKGSQISTNITENSLNVSANTPFTLQFYIYLHTVQTCNRILELENRPYGIGIFSNRISLNINDRAEFITLDALPIEQWHHLALTQDDNRTIRLYANGELLTTRTLTFNSFNIRKLIFDGLKQLNGYISDIHVVKENLYGDVTSFAPPTHTQANYNKTIYLPTQYNHTYKYYQDKYPFLLKPNSSVLAKNSPFGEGVDGSMIPNTTITGTLEDKEIILGEQDFTIEWWDYIESMSQLFQFSRFGPDLLAKYFPIFAITDSQDRHLLSVFHIDSTDTNNPNNFSKQIKLALGATNEVLFNIDRNFNTWSHYAITKSGTIYTLYINGIKISSKNNSTVLTTPFKDFRLGNILPFQTHTGSPQRNGFISNIRFVLDKVLYEGEVVSVPSEPLSYIPKTVFLYNAPYSTEFITNFNSATVCLVEGEDVLDFDASPFATLKEDCMFFDGTFTFKPTDTTPSNFNLSESPFTIECWLYNIDSKDCTIFSRNEYSLFIKNKTLQWDFKIKNTSNFITVFYNNFTRYLRKWVHVAVTYDGDTMRLYVDGVRRDIQGVPLGALLATNTASTSVTIGNIHNSLPSNTKQCYFGYISNFRLSNVCLYTSSQITVPEEPLTADNSKLLLTSPYPVNDFKYVTDCPFPNVVPEKTGFFNNYKSLKTADPLPAMTEDFTIELWFYYIRTNNAKEYIMDSRLPNTDEPFVIGINEEPNKVRIQETSTNFIDVGFVLPNQWHHLAVVRKNNYIQVYINGVLEGGMYSLVQTWPGNQLLLGKKNPSTTSKESNFIGYISNIRIVRNEALYDTDFGIPSTHNKDSTHKFLLQERVGINSTILTTETKNLSEISNETVHICSVLDGDNIEERNVTLQDSQTINNLYIHNRSTLHVPINADAELEIIGKDGLQITSGGKLNIT